MEILKCIDKLYSWRNALVSLFWQFGEPGFLTVSSCKKCKVLSAVSANMFLIFFFFIKRSVEFKASFSLHGWGLIHTVWQLAFFSTKYTRHCKGNWKTIVIYVPCWCDLHCGKMKTCCAIYLEAMWRLEWNATTTCQKVNAAMYWNMHCADPCCNSDSCLCGKMLHFTTWASVNESHNSVWSTPYHTGDSGGLQFKLSMTEVTSLLTIRLHHAHYILLTLFFFFYWSSAAAKHAKKPHFLHACLGIPTPGVNTFYWPEFWPLEYINAEMRLVLMRVYTLLSVYAQNLLFWMQKWWGFLLPFKCPTSKNSPNSCVWTHRLTWSV